MFGQHEGLASSPSGLKIDIAPFMLTLNILSKHTNFWSMNTHLRILLIMGILTSSTSVRCRRYGMDLKMDGCLILTSTLALAKQENRISK